MCDTVFAAGGISVSGSPLFGKNSDRERNEAQIVEQFSGDEVPTAEAVRCTYVDVPQARRTFSTLLCRPFWIWGAEMGANEHGVVIGNEGLHAKIGYPVDRALTGMDLVRLGLERSTCAAEAVEIITGLLSHYGQGGNCGHLTPTYYHNGFLIADQTEAFVLETVGRDWVCEQATGARTISNCYSVVEPQRASATFDRHVKDRGSRTFAEIVADRQRQHLGGSVGRSARSLQFLTSKKGAVKARDIMSILRDHGPNEADLSAGHRTLCMHAFGHDNPGQTTGSLVSDLGPDNVHWVTATAAPCLSIFKPVFLDIPVPSHGCAPAGQFDPSTLWWRHETFHRAAAIVGIDAVAAEIQEERDTLEGEFAALIETVRQGDPIDRKRIIDACWERASATEARWAICFADRPATRQSWHEAVFDMNRIAAFDLKVALR